MDENKLKISDEVLENLSMEQLIELKTETDDLLIRLNSLIKNCDRALNS